MVYVTSPTMTNNTLNRWNDMIGECVAAWAADRLKVGGRVSSSDAYRDYLASQPTYVASHKAFSRAIDNLGYIRIRRSECIYFMGVELRA